MGVGAKAHRCKTMAQPVELGEDETSAATGVRRIEVAELALADFARRTREARESRRELGHRLVGFVDLRLTSESSVVSCDSEFDDVLVEVDDFEPQARFH